METIKDFFNSYVERGIFFSTIGEETESLREGVSSGLTNTNGILRLKLAFPQLDAVKQFKDHIFNLSED